MQNPFFFGYGSLVNRDTHAFANAHPATLSGWRRRWCHTHLRPIAYLSIVPALEAQIAGLIAEVPDADWAALDVREKGYDRLGASDAISHALKAEPDVQVYAVPETARAGVSEKHPVMLSYVDVVVQGYLREFGEAGAVSFFDTTDGWDCPFVDDRANPVYPRHQKLSADETAFVDTELARVSARIHRRL